MIPDHAKLELPSVDEHLIAPTSRFELENGNVIFMEPADEYHAVAHANLAAVLSASCAPEYNVAVRMLARATHVDDFAPAVSLYPSARDLATGGRQIEEIAFEIATGEELGRAGSRAAKLARRGVRRVFAIDLAQPRVLEWSPQLDVWLLLGRHTVIEDRALLLPIPVRALVDAVVADDTVAKALRARRHPEFVAEHAEGQAEERARLLERIDAILRTRGIALTDAERASLQADDDA